MRTKVTILVRESEKQPMYKNWSYVEADFFKYQSREKMSVVHELETRFPKKVICK